MQACRYLLGVVLMISLAPSAKASEAYDNPGMGDTPCVILQTYQASNGDSSFGAAATLENVCGRSVEVSFCFPFVTTDDGIEPHCRNDVLRPWGTSRIVVSDLPAKLANPDYSWRWLGHLTDSDR